MFILLVFGVSIWVNGIYQECKAAKKETAVWQNFNNQHGGAVFLFGMKDRVRFLRDEIVVFTRNLFNSTFKTNPFLERAILTGITRVSKESIFRI